MVSVKRKCACDCVEHKDSQQRTSIASRVQTSILHFHVVRWNARYAKIIEREEIEDPSVEFIERKIGADNEVGANEWRVWILFELESTTQLLFEFVVPEPEIL